jgi:hypothetical protein
VDGVNDGRNQLMDVEHSDNHGDAGNSYNPLWENGSQPEEVGVDTSAKEIPAGELQGNAKDMLNNEEQSRPNDSRPGSLFDCPSLDCGGLNRPFSHGIDRPSILEDIWLDQLLGAF